MDDSFSSSPRPPRTPNASNHNRRSIVLASAGGGAHTPRTPYATVHKARMITSTIRRRRRQHQLEEVMTPYALRARQTLANTPGRRARLGVGDDGIFQRVSPRDELRTLSRVLARERQVREKLEELNRKQDLEVSGGSGPGSPIEGDAIRESTKTPEIAEELSNAEDDDEDIEEMTPIRHSSRRAPSRDLVIESRSVTPETVGNMTMNRSMNMSQLEIEVPRNDQYDRLSLGKRMSEAFPEFNLTQAEEDEEHEDEDEGEVQNILEEDFEEQRRKESIPFVIEVDDFEIADIPDIPDEAGDFTIGNVSDDDGVPLENVEERAASDIDVDEAENFQIAETNVEDPENLHTVEADAEDPGDLHIVETGAGENVPSLDSNPSIADANDFTTEDDHEAYTHYVDDDQDIDIDQRAPFDTPTAPEHQSLLKSLVGIDNSPYQFDPTSNEVLTTRARPTNLGPREPRARPTIPARIIKDLTASMSSRKLHPTALAEIMNASEEFFQQAGLDLAAYARHSKRKNIDALDVLQLMRRQRATSSTESPFVLAKRYLPQELVDEILDATSKLNLS